MRIDWTKKAGWLATLALAVVFVVACGSDDGAAAPEPAATAVQAQPAQPTQAAAVAPAPTTAPAPAAPTIVPTTAAPPTPRDLAASMGAQPTATSEPAAPAATAAPAPTTPPAQAIPIGSEVGERAPDFEMTLADGSVVSLASLMAAERPTFLYFFATF